LLRVAWAKFWGSRKLTLLRWWVHSFKLKQIWDFIDFGDYLLWKTVLKEFKMSNMLEQVIVDAEALKEVAIKNAEAAIVEKYSNDIKKAVDQLLEQGPSPEEMAMMGAPPGTPDAAGGMDAGSGEAVGPNIPEAHMPEKTVTLNLSELVQEMKMDDLDPKEKQVRELVAEEVTGGEEVAPEQGEETITINESVIADILGEGALADAVAAAQRKVAALKGEKMTSDHSMGGAFRPMGWSGGRGSTLEEQEELEEQDGGLKTEPALATGGQHYKQGWTTSNVDLSDVDNPGVTINPSQQATVPMGEKDPQAVEREGGEKGPAQGFQEQLQAYQHNYAKLYESHQAYEQHYAQLHQQAGALHEQNNKFRQMLVKAQEKLNEVNVRNAQLHYTNRTLISDSLNERQKDKIVEAIEKAGTVEEAKVIFETLQSAVAGAKPNKETPKSLNEAINKRSSAFLPRKEEKQSDPSFADRMQRLAGIK
jgi:hypothetical protein